MDKHTGNVVVFYYGILSTNIANFCFFKLKYSGSKIYGMYYLKKRFVVLNANCKF